MSSGKHPAEKQSLENLHLKWVPTVVTWKSSDGQEQVLRDAHLDLVYNHGNQSASFKFRAKVTLREQPRTLGLTGSPFPLYVFIDPTRVRSIGMDLDWSTAQAPAAAREKFGANAWHLQFTVDHAGELVGPLGVNDWTPKNQTSNHVLEALRSMATATHVDVFLAPFGASSPALSTLCDAASSPRGLQRPPGWPGFRDLYKGRGAQVAPYPTAGSDIKTAGGGDPSLAAQADSPPSYDELGPGPPMPPIDNLQGPSKRRRRGFSDVEGADGAPMDMESLCRKVLGDMKSAWTSEIKHELRKDMLEQAQAAVMADVRSELRGMEDRVVSRLEDRVWGDWHDKWSADLSRIEQEAIDYTDTELEEWRLGVKIELLDTIREETQDAENRILRRLGRRLSSAHLTLELDSTDDE